MASCCKLLKLFNTDSANFIIIFQLVIRHDFTTGMLKPNYKSMQWKHKGSLLRKIFHTRPLAAKNVASIFLGCQGNPAGWQYASKLQSQENLKRVLCKYRNRLSWTNAEERWLKDVLLFQFCITMSTVIVPLSNWIVLCATKTWSPRLFLSTFEVPPEVLADLLMRNWLMQLRHGWRSNLKTCIDICSLMANRASASNV